MGKIEKSESSASGPSLFKEDLPRKITVSDVWMNLHKAPPKKSRALETAAEGTLMGRLADRMAARDMIDELDLGPVGRAPTAKAAAVADNDIPQKIRIEGPALTRGTNIEREHAQTVKNLKENPKMNDIDVYKNIAKDHLNEHRDYYDPKKGLPAMEKALETQSKALETQSKGGMGLHQQMTDIKASNFSDPFSNTKTTPGSNMADQAKNSGNVFNTMIKKISSK